MGWLIFWLVVIAVVWGVVDAGNKAKMAKAEENAFAASHKGWDVYVSPHSRTVLGLNRDADQIVLGPITAAKQYPLSAVAQIEVLRDGASVTTTDRGSQAAGAAIGALAFGGIGLLLGGLTGSKSNKATIHSIALKIIVDDPKSPVHVVEFFRSAEKKGTDASSEFVKSAAQKVDHFHALLVNALRKRTEAEVPKTISVSDEVARLWELRQAGALTEDEYSQQKRLLLGAKPQIE
ncbi:MAG: SHOCT domain-containing protein [Hyphomonadaceae bacterium]|nr:SHOCT domain-containing protein [Hyphomonadaceae bacterium]